MTPQGRQRLLIAHDRCGPARLLKPLPAIGAHAVAATSSPWPLSPAMVRAHQGLIASLNRRA